MSRSMVYEIKSIETLDKFAQSLIEEWGDKRIFALEGPMGAGKTTIINSICRHLQCMDNVSSPTFAIINVYRTKEQGNIYHFDLYRLKNADELLATGALEYFDSGSWCFIEWPEIADNLLPDDTVWIKIRVLEDDTRRLEVQLKAGNCQKTM
ncbi:MAG: tRNA (adenosine(37)-N6)-threonylcarbamoyltransferase complex ATPase subunit type 1 TsaE [Bacteroidales bacterium]